MTYYRLGVLSLFLAGILLWGNSAQGQTYYSLANFNNAGELNGENSTTRVLIAVRNSTAVWSVANATATGYDLSTDPLFKGLSNLPAVTWQGLVNIESQEKNDAVLSVVQKGNNWLFGATAPMTLADDGETPTFANYWVRTRDNAVIWNGRGTSQSVEPHSTLYTNWKTNEPNNSGNSGMNADTQRWTGGEPVAIFLGGESGVWNDNSWTNAPGGYVMEFDLGTTQTTFEIDPKATTHTLALDPMTGTYYLRGTETMYWSNAKQYAEMRTLNGVQGQLPTVPDVNVNRILAAMGGGWIGLTDDPAYGGIEESGSSTVGNAHYVEDIETRRTTGWAWSKFGTSTALQAGDYANWNGGEPNGGTSENHIEVQAGGGWNDLANTNSKAPLVEFANVVGTNFYVEQIDGARNFDLFRNQTADHTGYYAAINFYDPEAASDRPSIVGRVAFPGDTSVANDTFMLKATTRIYIPEAGTYVFGSAHDDAVQVFLDRGADAGTLLNWTGATDNTQAVEFSAAGYYNLTFFFEENTGGAAVNLIAMKAPMVEDPDNSGSFILKTYTNNNAGFLAMRTDGAALIGDTVNGGLDTILSTPLQVLGGFEVKQVANTVDIQQGTMNVASYLRAIRDDSGNTLMAEETGVHTINYTTPTEAAPVQGNFTTGESLFPGGSANNFVLSAEGLLAVTTEGWYTFGGISDDGFMLAITAQDGMGIGFSNLWGTDAGGGTTNSIAVDGDGVLYATNPNNTVLGGGSIYLDEGLYNLEYIFRESSGGEYAELWWAAGQWTSFNNSFQLLGSGPVTPEPATWVMMLLGLAGMLLVRWKRNRREV